MRAVLPQSALRSHSQPLEHRVLARWLIGRVWCGAGRWVRAAGRWVRAAGDRLRHRRLYSHPRVAQRRDRVQAIMGPRAGAAAVQPGPVLPRRPTWEQVGQIFQSADALLCPTATSGYVAGYPYLGSMEVGGATVSHNILGAMTLPFNIRSRCAVRSPRVAPRTAYPPECRWCRDRTTMSPPFVWRARWK